MSTILNNIRLETAAVGAISKLIITHELPRITVVPFRTKYYNNRHRDPKFRKERSWKVWKVELPDFDKMRKEENMGPDEIRSRLKEKGVAPPRHWNEREMYAACTSTIIEPYEPPSDDQSSSLLDSLKSPFASGKSLLKTKREASQVRDFEGEDFDLKEFAKQSVEIYIKAHEALAARDETKIFDYVTEYCFPMMISGLSRHTIIWKYLGEVEPPRVVQVRGGDLLSKGNKYSQITTRLHTKQMLSIYDRHGRLIHGSPTDIKEVLEYVVFEKYLANEYGLWRMHGRNKVT